MSLPVLTSADWVVGILALLGPAAGGAAVSDDAIDSFLPALAKATEHSAPMPVPSSITVEALTGSLDLAATLAMGRPVHLHGPLSPGRASSLLIRRAASLDVSCVSAFAGALDDQRLLLIAGISGTGADESLSPKLAARLPYEVTGQANGYWTSAMIARARQHLPSLKIAESWVSAFVRTALGFGIDSPRAVLQAVTAARALAALSSQDFIDDDVASLAAQLVFSHRVRHLPQQDELPPQAPPPSREDAPKDDVLQDHKQVADTAIILEAVKVALPAHILQNLANDTGKKGSGHTDRSIAPRKATGQRGRRIGNRRAASLARQRLDVLATLRSAAPWQPLRRRAAAADRMIVTRDDFRVARIRQRGRAAAIVAVDASGSTAFQRLAEAKGAVEAILAACYVRRDQVALVSFRGTSADVLLPPTRSLERARRLLAALPGGGGTPLASGLDQAATLARQARRGGATPVVVILTDGRANVTRTGTGGKAEAIAEAQAAARQFAAEQFDAMVIDVSPLPQKAARTLAEWMHARYLAMPRAGATEIAAPVSHAMQQASI